MTVKDALTLVNEIRKLSPNLNTIEGQFVAAVEVMCAKNLRLSRKQGDWLTRIYQRAAGGGIYQRKQFI